MSAAGDHAEAHWADRIEPFWQRIWPKSRNLMSEQIAPSLAQLIIATRDRFPEALDTLRRWLMPSENFDIVVYDLNESALAARHPSHALALLDATTKEEQWAPIELDSCLAAIAQGDLALSEDPRYKRLEHYNRRHHP